MILHTVVAGPLEVNCYILGCEKTNKAAVIDPGGDAERIISVIDNSKLLDRIIDTDRLSRESKVFTEFCIGNGADTRRPVSGKVYGYEI